jgi:hypothetical protein
MTQISNCEDQEQRVKIRAGVETRLLEHLLKWTKGQEDRGKGD